MAAESQAELARKVAESANEVAALRQELATAEAGECHKTQSISCPRISVTPRLAGVLEANLRIVHLSCVAAKHTL